MGATNRTSAAKARTLKRQQQALELRRAGHGYVEIAKRIGIGKSQAHALVQKGLEETRTQITESADSLRLDELSRLDGMLAKAYPKAARGDLQAIDRVIKIVDQRSKLLGLHAPTRTVLQGGGDDAPPITTSSEVKVGFYIPINGRD